MLTAAIFIKRLEDCKSRMAGTLSQRARKGLAVRMLLNVIDAVANASGVDEVVVVSPDPVISNLVRRAGIRHLLEPEWGDLNSAALFAAERLVAAGTSEALLLPADLPNVQAEHIDALVRVHMRSGEDIIVPAVDQSGTNALLIQLPPRFALAYGPGSFARHLANAARAQTRLIVHQCSHLGQDIDCAEDLMSVRSELVT